MLLFVLAYLAGVLTIVSPCILPVLPFVFARADKPFLRSGLPMLAGMALTFALVASLAAVAGGWAVEANCWGRVAAMALLFLFGLALLFPRLSVRLTQPLVDLGARLSLSAEQGQHSGAAASLLLGAATGLLWAPCAGPVLGLILTGAALQGANAQTSLLLAAYAAGAATSLALALMVGGKVFAAMKRSLGAGEWIRRGLGAAVLAAVVAIALGLDTGFLTNVSLAGTTRLEQGLLDRFSSGPVAMKPRSAPADALPVEGTFPSLGGAIEWLNSPPLSRESLKGKVVLVDFWTYSCINCLRALPYVRAWADRYRDDGLVVIGVHTPEFAFEKDIGNVRKAASDLGVTYPVAIDNNYTVWRAFNNQYWPAHYFIDAEGRIRHHHFGEGDYDGSERVIQQLLAEANGKTMSGGLVNVNATGTEAASDWNAVGSPETYIGYARAENFVSPGGAARETAHAYTVGKPALNQWGLSGNWTVGREHAALNETGGGIVYRFHARDLLWCWGRRQTATGPLSRHRRRQARRRSRMDADAGEKVAYQPAVLPVDPSKGPIADRTFEIRFLDPGVEAYAFTFG